MKIGELREQPTAVVREHVPMNALPEFFGRAVAAVVDNRHRGKRGLGRHLAGVPGRSGDACQQLRHPRHHVRGGRAADE